MSSDDEVWEAFVRQEFVEAVASGTPVILAGHQVGWSPRMTKQRIAEPEFAELIAYAKVRRDDRIEKVLYDIAEKGNMQAIAMILLNRRGSEFKDVKKIEVQNTGSVTVEHVLSVKQGLIELMAEHGAEAFQIGGVLDVESSEDTDDPG